GAEILSAQREAVLRGRHPTLVPLLQELNLRRGWVARKTFEGPGEEGPVGHLECLQRWHAESATQERRLARRPRDTTPGERFKAIRVAAVHRCLPRGAALIEYLRLPLLEFRPPTGQGEAADLAPHYWAFVTGPARKPRLFCLGAAEALDCLINDFRTSTTIVVGWPDPGGTGGRQPGCPGQRLRAAVFAPLTEALGDCRRLVLSPDGDLNRLPFGVLPLKDGRHLLDAYRLSYVSVGRDVLRFGKHPTRQGAA